MIRPPSKRPPAPDSLKPRPRIIEGPYLNDLLQQPTTLQHAIDGLPHPDSLRRIADKLATHRLRHVVLTGMGTSFHALYPLHLALHRQGVASHWIETSELLAGFESLYRHDTLVILVSQSGESAEVVHLLKRTPAFAHLIGLTNHPDSSLGRHAHTVLPLNAGPESTVSCKSYLATLAALHWLAAVLGRRDPARAISELRLAQRAVHRYLKQWRNYTRTLITLASQIECVFVTGRGESLATAGTGGLILKESTHVPAEGMSCAAFRHGPLEMAGSRSLVLVCAGSPKVRPLNRRLYRHILNLGGRAAWLSMDSTSAPPFRLPPTPAALSPLTEILPVQMLSLALAALQGREAGRFVRASKITTTA